MKYCGKCGAQNRDDAQFCYSCGNQFETINQNEKTYNQDNSNTSSIKDKSAKVIQLPEKKSTTIIIGLVVLLIILYFVGRNMTSAQNQLNGILNAIAKNDSSSLVNKTTTSDSKLKLDKNSLEPLTKYYSANKEEFTSLSDGLKTQLNNITTHDEKSSITYNGLLLKKSGKMFLIFDAYKLDITPVYVDAETNIANAVFKINGAEVKDFKKDETQYSKKIGPLVPGTQTITGSAKYNNSPIKIEKTYDVLEEDDTELDLEFDVNSNLSKNKAPVEGAYIHAGGKRPSDAIKIPSLDGPNGFEVAVLKTPSGNIICDFDDYQNAENGGCHIYSYDEEDTYNLEGEGYNYLSMMNGQFPTLGKRDDVANYSGLEDKALIADYGNNYYFNDFVCNSAYEGLTCWNTKTGHGAFINREEYLAF